MLPGNRTRLFAVLGGAVSHSMSPAMHNAAFRALGLDAVFLAMPCSTRELPGLMRALVRNGGGGSITAPHKAAAAAQLDSASRSVVVTGSCNTFWSGDGALEGDNTDVDGVDAAVEAVGAPGGPWCVAGTGGAARAVVEAARQAGVALAVISREAARGREFAARAAALGVPAAAPEEAVLLVNATPIGLHAGDRLPFEGAPVRPDAAVLDLVYAPGGTPWVRQARTRGVPAVDGREMLLAQGLVAFTRWVPGQVPPRDVMRAALDRALG